jgi:hypothetical protein
MIRFLIPLLFALLLGGCADKAFQVHVQTALTFRAVNDEAAELIETGCDERVTAAASDTSVTTEEAERNSAALLAECGKLVLVQHSVAEAHQAWSDTLLAVAAEAENVSLADALPILRGLVHGWLELVAQAEAVGLEVPQLPPTLDAFLRGFQ